MFHIIFATIERLEWVLLNKKIQLIWELLNKQIFLIFVRSIFYTRKVH